MVTAEEVIKLQNLGLISKKECYKLNEVEELVQDTSTILNNVCSQRCQVRIKEGDTPQCFKCKIGNNLHDSKDNTKDCYCPLPIEFSDECKEALIEANLMEPITTNVHGCPSQSVFVHEALTPSRHVPVNNPNEGLNISPCNPAFFADTRSMQNLQILTDRSGGHQYVNKYISKVDKQNTVIVNAHPHKGNVVCLESQFLHNTKITTSAFVYFLISRDHPTEFYVGECQDLPTRLRKHNSGNGSFSTGYYAPYAVFAYICGFDCNRSLCLYVENEWKNAIGDLISRGIRCRIRWALVAQTIVTKSTFFVFVSNYYYFQYSHHH